MSSEEAKQLRLATVAIDHKWFLSSHNFSNKQSSCF